MARLDVEVQAAEQSALGDADGHGQAYNYVFLTEPGAPCPHYLPRVCVCDINNRSHLIMTAFPADLLQRERL